MDLDPAACYRAILARDKRFDGRFFTCVTSTGIYCRPICPARPPKLANCIFVATAAAAQNAGFRPCLRCRPESSPDLGIWLGTSTTVSRALKLIEAGALDRGPVEALAGRLGVGERHLRRLFRHHLGASPVAVAQTRRVLLAKQLLHQTSLSMTDVALASGFGSIRRFNETFQQLFARSPGALRRRTDAEGPAAGTVELLLAYREPYDWAGMLAALATRAAPGVEEVDRAIYRRSVEVAGCVGTIAVSDVRDRGALRATLQLPSLGGLPSLIAAIRHVFDLATDPAVIAAELGRDRLLAPLLATRPGLRVPGAWFGFEAAVACLLQRSLGDGATPAATGRLAAALGTPLPENLRAGGLRHAFPQPARLAVADLASLGLPTTTAHALTQLARIAADDPDLLGPHGAVDTAALRLGQLPGVDADAARAMAVHCVSECDVLPLADPSFRAAAASHGMAQDAAALRARAEAWRPWRAYAALHLMSTERARPESPVAGPRQRIADGATHVQRIAARSISAIRRNAEMP
ncbi:bifunctional transcriptional activator/DNA repair enzyme AdaA [Chelatococcus reniformis]|uniref:AraC family transcriptional regulator n=1 Tax=Chelatococcus reniformis TaxID=1494448 RepID=A0A916XNA6_9HYPH|nr:AlkA N-terminal domain-containing protein [Chelatococcus reniformis]GGC86250.1 AraC family transcriptional regulator [Chelatococcus reniformis]